MLINKEQFRNFEKNLLVFFAAKKGPAPKPVAEPEEDKPKDAKPKVIEAKGPKIEYKSFSPAKTEIGKDFVEEPKSSNEFSSKRNEALTTLDKIHLDINVGEESEAEKDLKDRLKIRINNEFKLLEHNYQEKLDKVGQKNEKATKARKDLNKAADNYIFKLEMFVIKQSINEGDENGASLMAQARLIDDFTKVPGFGRHFINGNKGKLKGLLNSTNRKDFNKALEKMLDNEDNLENGIREMIKRTPKFKKVNEKSHVERIFTGLIRKSLAKANEKKDRNLKLTRHVGEDNEAKLADTFTRRFDIVFHNGKIEYYVDLMDNNTVYKPDKIDAVLLRLSKQDEYSSLDKIDDYNEKIDDAAEEQAEMHAELKSGEFWDFDDEEVTGLSTLRGNPMLNKLIASTEEYEKVVNKDFKEIAEQLAELNGLTAEGDKANAALARVKGQLSPNNLRGNEALGNASALVALLALVRALADSSDFKGLGEVADGIGRGENPAEGAKESKERYEDNMPKATVADLLKAYTNPKGDEAKKLFAKKGKDKKDDGKVDKYLNIALRPVIEKHLKDELGFDELKDIKETTAGTYEFNFKKGDNRKEFIIEIKEKGLKITDTLYKNKPRNIDNTQSALKEALGKSFAQEPEVKKKGADKIPTNTRYIDEAGVLKKEASSVAIHKVLDTKIYKEAVIILGSAKRSSKQKFGKDVKEVTVALRKVAGDLTYVITDGPHINERLYVYGGDKIKSVKKIESPKK